MILLQATSPICNYMFVIISSIQPKTDPAAIPARLTFAVSFFHSIGNHFNLKWTTFRLFNTRDDGSRRAVNGPLHESEFVVDAAENRPFRIAPSTSLLLLSFRRYVWCSRAREIMQALPPAAPVCPDHRLAPWGVRFPPRSQSCCRLHPNHGSIDTQIIKSS